MVSAVDSGLPPHEAVLFLECTASALSIGEDGCDNQRNAVRFADDAGVAAAALPVDEVVPTATGPLSCLATTCLLIATDLAHPGDLSYTQVAPISFAPSPAPAAPASAAVAAAAPGPVWVARTARDGARDPRVLRAGNSASLSLSAGPSSNLMERGQLTGPFPPPGGLSGPAPAIGRPQAGEGVLQLTLAAPGTSWRRAGHTAVTVRATVDHGTPQTFVLFAGGRSFTYAGFTGPLTTGRHTVWVAIDPKLSAVPRPVAVLVHAQLQVVLPRQPWYLPVAYAPIVYGRSDSAYEDTPLITSVVSQKLASGATNLSYTTIWSREASGTAFVPWLEWGEWGRMTDITGTLNVTVLPSGAIGSASFNWCGCGPGFDDRRLSPQEVEQPFHGSLEGTHAVLRNASGNDYQDDQGIPTGDEVFRMQQPPVAGPLPGQDREVVMDRNPWTYVISNQEVERHYADFTLDPRAYEPGDVHQYAIVSMSPSGPSVSALGVALRFSGSSRWYSNDGQSGFSLLMGGRTAIKLPLDWRRHRIAAVRVSVWPPTEAGSVRLSSFRLLALDETGSAVRTVTAPAPAVVPGVAHVRSALRLRPRRTHVRVSDQAGWPLRDVVVSLTPSRGSPVLELTTPRGIVKIPPALLAPPQLPLHVSLPLDPAAAPLVIRSFPR